MGQAWPWEVVEVGRQPAWLDDPAWFTRALAAFLD
jgi:hypothetical protein